MKDNEAFFDFFKEEQEKQKKKVYATTEAYKTEHQEEQNKHIKESVEAAVKSLSELPTL